LGLLLFLVAQTALDICETVLIPVESVLNPLQSLCIHRRFVPLRQYLPDMFTSGYALFIRFPIEFIDQ
jgi:hypothetical protein